MLIVLHQSGGGHGHSHGGGHSHQRGKKKKMETDTHDHEEVVVKKNVSRHNINVTAASIHVIGDFLQTVGVLITSYIVWFRVSWESRKFPSVYPFVSIVVVALVLLK